MTLSSELLPAVQHYALLAAGLTLFSLSLTHVKQRFSRWLWPLLMALPIAQMEWSVWETISSAIAADEADRQLPIAFQALVHGIAIWLILAVVLYMANQPGQELPRRVKLEPTVRPPPK